MSLSPGRHDSIRPMEVGYMYGSHLRRTHALTLVAAVAVLAMVTTACSSSGSSPSTTTSTTASAPSTSASSSDPGGSLAALQSNLATYEKAVTNYATVQPISGGVSALKGKTVWYIPIGSAIPTLAAIGTAMQTAF